MVYHQSGTIFALSTPPGRGGIAIIRISGEQSDDALHYFDVELPDVRIASVRQLKRREEVIDQALVIRFAEHASFTGEKMVELHIHGGLATVNRVIRELGQITGFQLAEAGEFTRRALSNDKMDLTQVEALADLIDAQTEVQRRQAMSVMSGALSDRIADWRDNLLRALALTEAAIDFADEEDAPVDVSEEVISLVDVLRTDISLLIDDASFSVRLREGFVVALVGPPNVGKSSLINALAKRDVAITSSVAGTTRDVIEVDCDFFGLPVTVLDTAGIRNGGDEVEKIGIDRAIARASDADIRVFLETENEPRTIPEGLWREGDVLLWNKVDLAEGHGEISISTKTGKNIDELIRLIADRLSWRGNSSTIVARERHVNRLSYTLTHLGSALVTTDELRSEHLRQAVRGLDEIVGAVDVEDVLDEIFSSFCIGK